jgi:predicted phosphodiesterase
VPRPLFRILSDVHYGDRASRVRRLAQLRPLLGEAEHVVFNGDTLDTRPGPRPEHTQACREEIAAWVRAHGGPVTFLTGNHDPDFSATHAVSLAGDRLLATHGDIVFDDIVPWGRDGPLIREKLRRALAASARSPAAGFASLSLEQRFALWRAAAASTPQRHQSESNGLKYALRFAADTVWPPLRVFRVLRAWRAHAPWIGEFARVHWPAARFIAIGHTHRPGVTRLADGRIVINTGSFTPPLGGCVIDLLPERLRVRRVELRAGEFIAADTIAEFPLPPA